MLMHNLLDLATISEAKNLKLNVHLSTQASVSNAVAAEYFHKQLKIKKNSSARECSLEQIKHIRKKLPKLELEVFIPGAMCVSESAGAFYRNTSSIKVQTGVHAAALQKKIPD